MAPIDQDEIEKQLALKAVMDHAVRTTRAVIAAKPMRSYAWRPIILAIISLPSLLFATYTFVARPAFIFGPDPARTPVARRDADTRLAMFLVNQRVLEYRAGNNNRLPESLAAIGEEWQGISYRVVNDSVFELNGRVGSTTLTLRSDQKIDPFIAQGINLIRRRRP